MLRRTLLRSGSASGGWHFLTESRYGICNAPVFSLFPDFRSDASLLTGEPVPLEKAAAPCTTVAGGVALHDEDGGTYDLYGTSHNAVTLRQEEVTWARAYIHALLSVCPLPQSRDYIAGWAATVCSSAELVECALQGAASPASPAIQPFLDSLARRKDITEAQRELVMRCFVFDAVTATVRARAELPGVEELLNEQQQAQHAPEGKQPSEAQKQQRSKWVDSVLSAKSPEQHPLAPVLRFAREHTKLSDSVVAEMIAVALEELAVSEEKFSLLADGKTGSKLSG